jgi:hypothetical protein
VLLRFGLARRGIYSGQLLLRMISTKSRICMSDDKNGQADPNRRLAPDYVNGPRDLEGSQNSLFYRRFCHLTDLWEQCGRASGAPSLQEPDLIGFGNEFESAGSSP